jgi:phospho-N-acetylmuramoyl-pentapeptide-transferase
VRYNLDVHFYLGLLILSFAVTFALIIPFIGLLYRLKFLRGRETEEVRRGATANFYKIRQMHEYKAGVPSGGGILVVAVVTFVFAFAALYQAVNNNLYCGHPIWKELTVIFYTFVGFGLLGLYDDLIKIFGFIKTGFFGLRMRHKFIIQWLLGFIVAGMIYWGLGADIVNIPYFGYLDLGWWIVPLAAFLVVGFANAFDFTDGLDGLSCGLLLICLLAFWVIALADLDHVMSLFIVVWTGAVLAFLYFNIYPARIMLGNVGGLAFGATLAVVGLLSGKVVALLVIGGVFIAEGTSSLLQLMSKKFMKKRLFPIAPLHHWLQLIGWEEPKIVARAWLTGAALAIFGVWLAML